MLQETVVQNRVRLSWPEEQILTKLPAHVILFATELRFCSRVLTETRVVVSPHWDSHPYTSTAESIGEKALKLTSITNDKELVWCFQELFGGNLCPTWIFYRYINWTQNNICISFIREVNSAQKTGPVLPKTPQRIHKQDNKRDITGHMKLFCPQYSLWQTERCADKFSPYDKFHYI